MVCIICISNKNFNKFLLLNIFSSLFHSSAIIFSSLLIVFVDSIKKRINIFIGLFLGLILMLLTFYSYESVIYRITEYIKPNNTIDGARSSIFIWIINILPITLYLKNISKFKFNDFLKRIIIFFLLYEIFSFFLIFFDSALAYRFLLYSFPISIYITSSLPDVDIFKIKKKYITFFIVFLCFASLAFWLKNAYHAFCWLPYKNIILKI